jgi:hypothetical protein
MVGAVVSDGVGTPTPTPPQAVNTHAEATIRTVNRIVFIAVLLSRQHQRDVHPCLASVFVCGAQL